MGAIVAAPFNTGYAATSPRIEVSTSSVSDAEGFHGRVTEPHPADGPWRDTEQTTFEAEQVMHDVEQRTREAEQVVRDNEQRIRATEQVMHDAEQRTRDAEQAGRRWNRQVERVERKHSRGLGGRVVLPRTGTGSYRLDVGAIGSFLLSGVDREIAGGVRHPAPSHAPNHAAPLGLAGAPAPFPAAALGL